MQTRYCGYAGSTASDEVQILYENNKKKSLKHKSNNRKFLFDTVMHLTL